MYFDAEDRYHHLKPGDIFLGSYDHHAVVCVMLSNEKRYQVLNLFMRKQIINEIVGTHYQFNKVKEKTWQF